MTDAHETSRLTSQPAQSDLVERAKWVTIRQREAGDITAAKIIEDLLSNFDTPTVPQPDRESVLREVAEDVRINILWAERHYSGAEFGTIAWPEVKAAVDSLLALLTHPTTDTQSDAVREKAIELLREVECHIEHSHDEGCEVDPDFGEAAFDARMEEEDPDGELDDRWPKDAKCTCGTVPLAKRVEDFLASIRNEAANAGERP